MPVKVNLTNGKSIWLPDSWSDEQIQDYVARLGQREATSDYGSAFMRGLGQHAPDIVDFGAGAVGIAADITGSKGLQETELSIREFSDDVRNAVGGEAMQDYSDTFGEKFAEGLGAIPGIVGSFAPTMAIPGAGIPTAMARFGLHGAAMAGGEGPGSPIGGALQGAAAGAAFGGIGKLAGGLSTPIKRRLFHAGGVAGAVTGMGKLAGESDEDALAMGLAMGAVGLAGKVPSRLEAVKSKEVMDILRQVRKDRPELTIAQAKEAAALQWSAKQRDAANAEAAKRILEEQAETVEGAPKVEGPRPHPIEVPGEKPKTAEELLGLTMQNKVDPYIQGELAKGFNKSVTDRVQTYGFKKALQEMPAKEREQIIALHPYSAAQAMQDVASYTPSRRQYMIDKFSSKGKIIGDHELIQINVLGKLMMAEHGDFYLKQSAKIKNMESANAATKDVKVQNDILDIAMDKFTLALADYNGLGTEMSRAFNIRKLVAGEMPRGHRALMQAMQPGKNPIPRSLIKRMLENPDDYRAAMDVVNESLNVKASDYLYEVWINGLLSGPPTHAVNIASNLVTQALGTVERGVAGMIDWGMHPGRSKAQRARFAGEMFADATGWVSGARAGWKEALKAVADDTYGYEVSKVDKPMFVTPGLGGKMIRTPSTVLRMADIFFKSIGAQRELHATAYRHGQRSGLKGKAKTEYIQSIIDKPDAFLLERMNSQGKMETKALGGTRERPGWMEEAGMISTFTNPLGEKGKMVSEVRDKTPTMRWIMPFVRTPLNIMKYGLKRTPLNILRSVSIYNKYRNGEMQYGAVVDEAAGTLLGTAMAATIFAFAKSGGVTGGGPADWQEQMNLRSTGWRPYSIKIGDTYTSYSRIEPLATIFGMAADAAETSPSDPDFADKLVAAVKENLTNKTFMVGVENLSKAWADPDMFAESYAKIMLGSFVPSVVGQVSNVTDPYVRTADLFETVHGVPEAMARRIPGLSSQLPIRYTAMGDPVERRERLGLGLPESLARGISPIEFGKDDPSKVVEAEMANLAQYPGLPPSMPSMSTTISLSNSPFGQKVKLTDDEYSMYHYYHQMARYQMEQAILDPSWAGLPPEIKAYNLSRMYRQYQRQANHVIKQSVLQRLYGGVDSQ